MKKEITKQQYLQLEGIRVLSKRLNEQLDQLVICVSEITGEELDESNYGHASDFIFGNETVKTHLRNLGVTISSKGLPARTS